MFLSLKEKLKKLISNFGGIPIKNVGGVTLKNFCDRQLQTDRKDKNNYAPPELGRHNQLHVCTIPALHLLNLKKNQPMPVVYVHSHVNHKFLPLIGE